jgi:hypothetical protein
MAREEDEVRELLMIALDGDLSSNQRARLDELLLDNETLRRTAARFLWDDSLLVEEIGALGQALDFLQQPLEKTPSGNVIPAVSSVRAAPSPRPEKLEQWVDRGAIPTATVKFGRFRRAVDYVNRHGVVVALAAGIAAIGFFWQYSAMMAKLDRLYALTAANDPAEVKKHQRDVQKGGASPGSPPVARVTGLSGCEWPAGETGLKFGDTLAPGQRLRLTKGVLQLTYDAGTRVMLEGPVDMVMTTAIEAKLSSGKIAAAVPRFARGYTILTPTAEVVDLGTEFGVAVDKVGDSEIHVFDGDVVTRPIGEKGLEMHLVHTRQDEAVKFEVDADKPERIRADSKKFVRRLIPDLPASELPPLPHTDKLALWLAADVMPAVPEGSPVSVWPDILIGENSFPDDAWQFDERLCPTWIRDAEDRPAIRFDGWSTYLSTSPMEAGDQQTAFVVFAPSPASFASAAHGGMLLKHGLNAPTMELSLLNNHAPRGLVWADDAAGHASNVGLITGLPVEPLAPCAVAYSYDVPSNRAELMVNGVSQGVTDAPRRAEQHAKKYIGSHAQPWYEAYFLGNMYEVIVYDGVLDGADRDRVFEYLSTRYGLKPGKSPASPR